MKQINDSLVMIMQPATPFLEWIADLGTALKSVPEDALTTDEMTEITAVLIQNKPDLEQFDDFLQEHCDQLLRHEFSSWTKDESLWTFRNDLEILLEYFHLEVYTNIVDLRTDTTEYHGIAILRPTTEFKDWLVNVLRAAGKTVPELEVKSTDPLQPVTTAYLLPDTVRTDASAVKFMREHFKVLLEYELNRYIVDQKYWPENRNMELFWLWFEMDLYQRPYIL